MTFVQVAPGAAGLPGPVIRPTAMRTVDHAVIAHNIRLLREKTTAKVMVVVKADAFGHGAIEVSRTAVSAGAQWLGVATVDEALELRGAGLGVPILAWLVDPWSDLAEAVRAGVTVSCANLGTLEAVRDAAALMGAIAEIHLEVDTGMARAGAHPDSWAALCAAAREAERGGRIRVTGVWSHLALATEPDWSGVEPAWSAFQRDVAVAVRNGLAPHERHLSNSAATLAHPRAAFTMVRCGAAVYGIETVDGRTHGLRYAMRAVSHITQLRSVASGVGVGYGHTFVTERPSTLALVPVGYADGVPRSLSGRGEVVVGGRRCPIVGAISMDQFTVDLGDVQAGLGDEVVLLGDAGAGEPDAAEWAAITGTLPHEILTGLGGRMRREHIGMA